jgi:hypothetical protein
MGSPGCGRASVATVAILVVGMLLARTVRADTPPWAIGVTDEQKASAYSFLERGNTMLLDKHYAEALEQYKAAVAVWDHPAIRFNIVRCLIYLDRPVEASDNLKRALEYGAAPLEEGVYAEALTLDKLLSNQIGQVAVSCHQQDVRVTLDGQEPALCPASKTKRIALGPHQLVATRDAFLTRTVDVVVIGGQTKEVELVLAPIAKSFQLVHRWATWKPWLVFGVGIAVAGIGAVIELNAVSQIDSYDRSVAQNCHQVTCVPGDPNAMKLDDGLRTRAELESRIAVSVLAVGAVTAAVGATMLYLNRGRLVESLTPAISVRSGGASLSLGRSF